MNEYPKLNLKLSFNVKPRSYWLILRFMFEVFLYVLRIGYNVQLYDYFLWLRFNNNIEG